MRAHTGSTVPTRPQIPPEVFIGSWGGSTLSPGWATRTTQRKPHAIRPDKTAANLIPATNAPPANASSLFLGLEIGYFRRRRRGVIRYYGVIGRYDVMEVTGEQSWNDSRRSSCWTSPQPLFRLYTRRWWPPVVRSRGFLSKPTDVAELPCVHRRTHAAIWSNQTWCGAAFLGFVKLYSGFYPELVQEIVPIISSRVKALLRVLKTVIFRIPAILHA